MPIPITVLDLFTEVLSIYGEYAPGESIDAESVQTLFWTLNAALDGIGIERLTIQSHPIITFATTAGKQSYNLGPDPSNDWITAGELPASIQNFGMMAGALELPVHTYTAQQWRAIGLKSLPSSIIAGCWPQLGAGFHTLNFWPVPSASIPINLYTSQQISRVASIASTMLLPGGYQEFLTYDLVIKTASKFGAPIPEWVPPAWREAKTRLKESNWGSLDAKLDPALTRRGRRGDALLSFYTGE